jgi:hypothetical protein
MYFGFWHWFFVGVRIRLPKLEDVILAGGFSIARVFDGHPDRGQTTIEMEPILIPTPTQEKNFLSGSKRTCAGKSAR